jgi:hypothetical protein
MSGMSEMGGKETTGVFVVHPEIQIFIFIFFFGVTWKAPRQRGMDAGWTRDGRLELLFQIVPWFCPMLDFESVWALGCTCFLCHQLEGD